jgi:hypothetical protein
MGCVSLSEFPNSLGNKEMIEDRTIFIVEYSTYFYLLDLRDSTDR